MDKLKQNFLHYRNNTADFMYQTHQKFLEPIKYAYMRYCSRYRLSPYLQAFHHTVKLFIYSYAFFNACGVVNIERFLEMEFHKTQYSKLVQDIRNEKDDHVKEAVKIILLKAQKQGQLSSMQILALNDLVKRQELNIHGEYLASLK